MDDDEPEPEPEPVGPLYRNARIVSQACDAYFAKKGLRCYDLKANQIDPITKQQLNPTRCNPSSTE
jgi:hypothetical protein